MKEYSEPYKEPKVILEVAKDTSKAFGYLIGVLEYEYKEKLYRKLSKVELKKKKNGEGFTIGKSKGFGLQDFIAILNSSEDIRTALDSQPSF